MLNLVNMLDTITDAGDLCNELSPVLRLVGIAVFIIKVVDPILLIVVGMLDMAKAVTEKDENKPSNVILEVLQKGYTYKDKVIRPAMVKVNE